MLGPRGCRVWPQRRQRGVAEEAVRHLHERDDADHRHFPATGWWFLDVTAESILSFVKVKIAVVKEMSTSPIAMSKFTQKMELMREVQSGRSI